MLFIMEIYRVAEQVPHFYYLLFGVRFKIKICAILCVFYSTFEIYRKNKTYISV